MILATFFSCCCCSCSCNSFYSKDSSRMGKHHGSEGRKSIKIAPKNSLMQLLKPIEKDVILATFFSCCCCSCSCNSFYSKDSSRMGKHHGSEGRKSIKIAPKNSLMQLLKPIEKDVILATFFSCCCCCSWSCNSFYSKSSSRMGKHHGSEGQKSIKIAPKNSLM